VTELSRAVFLSYASQDAEAARRISIALRSASVEVWFDQSELRGGDAWDQTIRKRLRDCRLFIPVISANTEARSEGYFRREWKLAVDRKHDMSERLGNSGGRRDCTCVPGGRSTRALEALAGGNAPHAGTSTRRCIRCRRVQSAPTLHRSAEARRH